jgi:hypothetical protein
MTPILSPLLTTKLMLEKRICAPNAFDKDLQEIRFDMMIKGGDKNSSTELRHLNGHSKDWKYF